MVQPPPGVSSTSRLPPTASTNPRATASPSPTPTPVSGVPEALERLEHPVAVLGADPRTAVDDPDVHPAGHRTGLDPEPVAPAVDERVVDQIGHSPLEEHRVGADAGERGFDVHGHLSAPGSEAGHGRLDELGDVGALVEDLHRAGLQAAHVQQVLHQAVEPVGFVVDGLQQDARSRRARRRAGRRAGSTMPP